MQTAVPVEHEVVAVSAHGFAEVHVTPAVQALQTPVELQTALVPQDVPVPTNVRSVQTGVPVEQSIVAVRAHGLLEVHDAPCVHAVHTPLELHTPVAPPGVVQAVPPGWRAWSVQTGAPLEQLIAAVSAHGLLEVQAAPCVHAVQTPAVLQTPVTVLVEHGVPAAAKV